MRRARLPLVLSIVCSLFNFEVKDSKYYFEVFARVFLSQGYLCQNFEDILFHRYLMISDFKGDMVPFFLPSYPPLVLVLSVTFIKLSLSSEG